MLSVRLLKALLLSLALFAAVGVVCPVQAAEEVRRPPFDFAIDVDGDGLPDELVAAIKQLRKLRKQNATPAKIEEARAALFERLPYSDQTRQRQAELATLYQQLNTLTDEFQRLALLQQIEQIHRQMTEGDPLYQLTIETFALLMPDRKVVQRAEVNAATTLSPEEIAAEFTDPTDNYDDAGQRLPTFPEFPALMPGKLSAQLYLPVLHTTVDEGASLTVEAAADWSTLGGDSPQQLFNAFMPTIGTPNVINFNTLSRGDLLLRDGKNSLDLIDYAKYYGHIGMLESESLVFDSTTKDPDTEDPDGVALRTINNWKKAFPVAVMRNNSKTQSEVRAALDWAIQTYNGKPYNRIITNKTRDDELYCSQLVWKLHGRMGVEVDSESQDYEDFMVAKFGWAGKTLVDSGVFPDEIFLDDSLSVRDRGLGKFE
jgi:hypothetical protein